MKELTVIFSIVIGVIVAIAVGMNKVSEYQCNSYGRISGKEVEYNNFDTCYVEQMRWDEYKARVIASEAIMKAKEQNND